MSEADAEYAVKIMNQIKLYGKPIRVNKASYDKKQVDVGANLFVGNLDSNVDEQTLYDTFSTFGTLADQPKVGSLVFFSCKASQANVYVRLRETLRQVCPKVMLSLPTMTLKLPIWRLRT